MRIMLHRQDQSMVAIMLASIARSLFAEQVDGVAVLSYASKVRGDLH